jgi:hypothetical protein
MYAGSTVLNTGVEGITFEPKKVNKRRSKKLLNVRVHNVVLKSRRMIWAGECDTRGDMTSVSKPKLKISRVRWDDDIKLNFTQIEKA